MAIVGESGCGKSVTSHVDPAAADCQEPPGRIAGSIRLQRAVNCSRCPSSEMRKLRGNDISMIFQEPMTSL